MASNQKTYRPETRLVHAGTLRSQFGETSEALFLTQGYVYPSAEECEARFSGKAPGYVYSRYSNPTHEHVRAAHGRARRRRGRALDGNRHGGGDHRADGAGARRRPRRRRQGAVRLLPLGGRGMAAALWRHLNAGRRQGPRRLEERGAAEHQGILSGDRRPTRRWRCYDIAAIAEIAHSVGAQLVVDNVFATPLYQSPLALGADCVVYSATKHIDGQGRVLGGVILGSEKFIMDHVHQVLRQTGPSLSPFNAWVLLKGLETLPLRVERQTENAGAVSDALAGHKKITRLIYPGRKDHPQAAVIAKQMKAGSTLCSFEVKGGKPGAFRFLNALQLIAITNNLGDAKSLVTHPTTTTHQRLTPEQRAELGIGDGLIRFSAGLEHPDDLIEDLLTALEAV